MIDYKVRNKVNPAKLSDVEILGSVAEQMNVFFEKRIFSDFARGAVYKETEDAFRTKLDGISDDMPGLWRGEFWGKWVISACRVAEYSKNSELKEFLKNSALTLISLADKDGAISTYHNHYDIFPRDGEKLSSTMGWKCTWNWNLWCRKYTLWGLIEVYMLTEDERILNAAVRHADRFIGDIKEQGKTPFDTGTFVGLPTGSVLKPMLILYRLTGEEKYLNFALYDIADDWEREDGRIPNIIANSLADKPVHEWYPNPEKWAKAYEMMSCFDGIVELYRVTGEEKYLRATENFYKNIKKYEFNAVFGMSANDQFYNAARYQNGCTEPCDIIHWMRLCYELFALTGKIEYMNDFEESFYNPFLAASFSNGEWGARALRTSGRHQTAMGQAEMKYSHCCVNNIPRGYMNFAQSQIMYDGKEVYINMFTEFNGSVGDDGNKTQITVSGNYLSDGKVNISVQNEQKTTLKIRIPSFSRSAEIVVNGNRNEACGNEYFSVLLDSGMNEIGMKFDMNPRIVDFSGDVTDPIAGDYVTRRLTLTQDTNVAIEELFFGRRSTLHYGPLLLTRSKKCGNTEAEMYEENESVAGKNYKAKIEPMKPCGTRVKFNVTLTGDETKNTVMCDYATGSNEHSLADSKLFSIWI